jgi:hypothetical protein
MGLDLNLCPLAPTLCGHWIYFLGKLPQVPSEWQAGQDSQPAWTLWSLVWIESGFSSKDTSHFTDRALTFDWNNGVVMHNFTNILQSLLLKHKMISWVEGSAPRSYNAHGTHLWPQSFTHKIRHYSLCPESSAMLQEQPICSDFLRLREEKYEVLRMVSCMAWQKAVAPRNSVIKSISTWSNTH